MGSEMCIRDSNDAEQQSDGDRSHRVPHRGSRELVQRHAQRCNNESDQRWAWRCTCLLYTSDAADDLLRVDLGGSRIIKKKKTTLPHSPPPHLPFMTPSINNHT